MIDVLSPIIFLSNFFLKITACCLFIQVHLSCSNIKAQELHSEVQNKTEMYNKCTKLTSDSVDVVVVEVLLKESGPPLLVVTTDDDEVGVCVTFTGVTL